MKRIMPVPGAACYFASTDKERPNKVAVWMVTIDDNTNEKYYYTLSHHNTFEVANKEANRWQEKENKSVLKHHPELSNNEIITP